MEIIESPKSKCVVCLRGMPPLKNIGRYTTYNKPDWRSRTMHKKCFAAEQKYKDILSHIRPMS